MKATLEDISGVKKKLHVEIGPKEVDKKIDDSYRALRKKAKIPGFRPGKAPRHILESRFAAEVMEDVTRELITESFPKAIEQVETIPLGPPLLEKDALKSGQAFKYTALLEVRPRIEIEGYLGVEVEREILSVVDEDVQQQLDQIRESHGKLTPVEEDRPVREDDYVILEYEGFENDRPIEGIKSANFLLKVGSGDFHPAFESGLIGMRKGTDGQIHVQFEEDFRHARLAGRSVSFRLKVLNIKTLEVPDLDDAFALSLGSEFQDLASLKSKINETLTAQEEKRIDRELKQNLIQKIADTVDFELPQVMVDTEVGYALETIRQNLQRSGSSFEKAGLSEERVRKDLRPASEKRVKNMLILSEIARRDAIAVEAEDLRKGFEEMAASTGQDPETIKKYYEARGMTESFEQKLLEEKTLNYLVEHAKILDVAKHAEAQ